MRELQAVIEGLAEQLNRAVAIDDPSIRLLAHTAHDEPVDQYRIESIMTLRGGSAIVDYVFGLGIKTSTEPVRIPGRPDIGMLGRLCIPIRCQSLLLGFLWLIDDDETLTPDEIEASIRAADAAGEVLFRSRLMDDLRRGRERELLLDLVNEDAAVRQHVTQADLDAAGLAQGLSCRVLLVSAPFTDEDLEAESGDLAIESVLRRGLRQLKNVRALVATRPGGYGYVLVAYRDYEDPLAQLRQMAAAIHEGLSTSLSTTQPMLIGIGGQVADIWSAHLSFRRAQGVLDVCRAVEEFAPVAAWEDIGIYRVLNQLPLDDLADVAIPPGLRALMGAKSDQWLIETLDTYLDSAGNVQESARRMHIHRATLYYRLTRIEELTGMSLADGQDRLALHLGVKLARLTGEIEGAPRREDDADA